MNNLSNDNLSLRDKLWFPFNDGEPYSIYKDTVEAPPRIETLKHELFLRICKPFNIKVRVQACKEIFNAKVACSLLLVHSQSAYDYRGWGPSVAKLKEIYYEEEDKLPRR